MDIRKRFLLASSLISRACNSRADLVGIAAVENLRNSPSAKLAPELPRIKVGLGDSRKKPGIQNIPQWGQSALVIGLSHPDDKPEMDWWFGDSSPPGNKELIKIIKSLILWLEQKFPEIKTFHPPYHLENGGIFLKDAAVMAGFGVIGKNNLLITPRFGPRIRLRSLIIDQKLPQTGPLNFDPCSKCPVFCRASCPQEAFKEEIISPINYPLEFLPAISGHYSRLRCNTQMEIDLEKSGNGEKDICKFCRSCELTCPVGITEDFITE